MSTVAVIDIENFGLLVKDSAQISQDVLAPLVQEVKQVLTTRGFCYLKNHGIDETLVRDYSSS